MLFDRPSRTSLAGLFALGLLAVPAVAAEAPPPPMAERKPVTSEHHGIAITDDYAWLHTEKLEAVLERPEALEAPIRKHLDAEARYARAVLAGNRNLERQLLAEMKARVSPRDATVPQAWGPWEYYTPLPGGLAAQAALPAAARRRGRADPARRERAGQGTAGLLGGGNGRQPRSQAACLRGRRGRLGAQHAQGARPRDRPRPAPIRSPRCAAARCGRRTASGCSTWAAIPPSGGRRSFAIGSARPSPRTSSSMRRWRRAFPSRCG